MYLRSENNQSVTRLHDGMTFSVGDMVKAGKDSFKIKFFATDNDRALVNGENFKSYSLDKIWHL